MCCPAPTPSGPDAFAAQADEGWMRSWRPDPGGAGFFSAFESAVLPILLISRGLATPCQGGRRGFKSLRPLHNPVKCLANPPGLFCFERKPGASALGMRTGCAPASHLGGQSRHMGFKIDREDGLHLGL